MCVCVCSFIYAFIYIFIGLVGECRYHKWFVITAGLLGSLLGLCMFTCLLFYCLKAYRQKQDAMGHHENGNKDFLMLPGTVRSLIRMYDEK